MKLKYLILLGFTLFNIKVYAQKDFREGYVIKNNGDTLKGWIDYRGGLLMSEVCRFKSGKDTEEIKYLPEDLNGYRFIEDKYYVSKEIDGIRKFLEFLVNGTINIYYLKQKDVDHFYIEKENSGLVKIPYEKIERQIDEKKFSGMSTQHIGFLNLYMNDAENFYDDIAKIKRLDQKNLIVLGENYHNNVCDEYSCIVYRKNVPSLKFKPEFLAGITRYKNDEFVVDDRYFQLGVISHIWFPHFNEKLFLRIGLLYIDNISVNRRYYSIIDFDKIKAKKNLYKIPLQIEYVYPRGIIRPKIAYGVVVNKFTGFQGIYPFMSVMAGFNVEITKSVALSINFDSEYSSKAILIVPDKSLANTLSTGISIQF